MFGNNITCLTVDNNVAPKLLDCFAKYVSQNIGYPELEGTYKDHRVQLLDPYTTTRNSNPVSENGVQTLFAPWQLRAVPTALGSLFLIPKKM